VKVKLADGSIAEVQAYANIPALLIVLAITTILVVGIRESAGFNAAMVILNLSVILLVIGLGATYVEPRNWKPFLHKDHGWRGVPLGAAHIFFAYIGFDSISTHAEEARNPRRDLAIGIISSLLICSVLYVAVAGILTGMIPYERIDSAAPLAAAFQARGAGWTSGLITGAILLGITSSLLVGMLSQPRILMAIARDGMLPPFFAAVHPRLLTPWKSTILVGLVVGVISALAPLSFLADLVSVGTLFAFLIVCVAVLILRYKDPEIPRPFRVPALPLVAGLGLLVNGGLMFYLGPDNWIRLGVWLALGLVIYFGYGRYHTRLMNPTEV
jgi:APA family basic amino acid/polyamine antiporter